ncbi:major facilitator superfamily domain-containing protein [Elsinoe ampelina]|uniref:Major facilitator superfamily domain-containing protein n=1 Tax=Elsinoe ampelina TaxID=302913 RepID=A0A6A6G3V4_9PEZI|nr:major facilitator superfamily domain-containing protein [Elsinoe ampelina]
MNVINVNPVPDYEVVAGTVYMIDGSGNAAFSKKDILLVPTPSSDLEDPLRWSRWRKGYHLLLLVAYSSLMGAITNWSSVIYVVLAQVYETTIANLSIGLALCLLMLGVANVFLIPLSNKLGRRATYNWSLLFVLGAEVWLARSKSIGDFQGAHVLLGIGAAPFEALVPVSVSDTYYAHERGTRLAYYVFGLAFGSLVGPICAGYMVTSQGWEWIYWWGVILTGLLTFLFFFTFEETYFERSADLHEAAQSLHVRKVEEMNPEDYETKEAMEGEQIHYATSGPKVGDILDTTKFRLQFSFFKLFPTTWSTVLNDFWRPLKVCSLPAIIWCGVNYGTCVSWLAVMGTTVAATLAPPPYLFSNSQIGLFWIAPLIGAIIGAIYSGTVTDRFVLLDVQSKPWIQRAEFRLWSCLPAAIIFPAGLMLYGIGAARGMAWIVLFVGGGLIGFGLSVGGSVSMAYTLDCYKEIDTQAITTIILIRNVVGFAITWAIQPWINNMGKQNAFIVVGCLAFTITGASVIFIFFGKSMRKWTEPRYAKLAAQR